ncbi:MAG TPA: YtoQ family protein [Alphaproteobacteria bacterium]|nr:YtoQ family protein [Alphaproteobacteria bacterium]
MSQRIWNIYLSGEIHTDWRERISSDVENAALPVRLHSPVCVDDSDDCGVAILGVEADAFWHDRKGASMNAIRTRTLIGDADIVIVRFGEKYRQWNAAFDAGLASAAGKPLITVHEPNLNHALKEIDAAALAVCRTTEQVAQTLAYVISGELPTLKDRLAAE